MQVMNKRSYEVEIPDVGFVGPGDVIEVDDALGRSLVKQVDAWDQVGGPNSRPSVPDVLDDVGDDPDKARQALALEREADKPRKPLIAKLQKIVNSEEKN